MQKKYSLFQSYLILVSLFIWLSIIYSDSGQQAHIIFFSIMSSSTQQPLYRQPIMFDMDFSLVWGFALCNLHIISNQNNGAIWLRIGCEVKMKWKSTLWSSCWDVVSFLCSPSKCDMEELLPTRLLFLGTSKEIKSFDTVNHTHTVGGVGIIRCEEARTKCIQLFEWQKGDNNSFWKNVI